MSTPLEFPEKIAENGSDQTSKKTAMLASLAAKLHRDTKPKRPPIPQRVETIVPEVAEPMAILACLDILNLIEAHIKTIPARNATFEGINKQVAAEKVFDGIKAMKPDNFIKTILDDIVSQDNPEETITDIVRRHFTILLGDFEDDWLPLIEIQAEINHFISCVTIIGIKKHQSTRRVTKMPVPPVTREAIGEVIGDTGNHEHADNSGPIYLELLALPDDDADALMALAEGPERQQLANQAAEDTPSASAAIAAIDPVLDRTRAYSEGTQKAPPLGLDQENTPPASAAIAAIDPVLDRTRAYSEGTEKALPFNLDVDDTPPPAATTPPVVATPKIAATASTAISPKPPRTSNRNLYLAFALLGTAAGIGGALWRNGVKLAESEATDTTPITATPQPLVPTVTNVRLPAPTPIPEISPLPQQRNTTVSVSSSFFLGTHSSLKLGVRAALLSNTAVLAHCITRPNTDPRHLAYGLAGPITSFIRTRGWTVGTINRPRGVTITWTDNGQCGDFKVTGWETTTSRAFTIVHPETPVPITTPIPTIVNNRALYHRLPPQAQ
jgi:hypothetical protein